MKNKTTAAIFAIFLGWAGIHRFYLGQTGLGILYFCLIFLSFGMIPFVLGLIDAIVLLNMDENEFNRKYNSENREQAYNRSAQNFGRNTTVSQRGQAPPLPRSNQNTGRELPNPYKVNGIKKYKEFDLDGAIEDFKKGLEISPRDISLHFNIACAYSLTEQVELAYQHLDKAVSLGFNDFEKIKTHDDLAFVRIQDRWDDFRNHGFKLQANNPLNNTKTPELLKEEAVHDDVLLSQLKRLAELRDRGLLSEQEFIIEKKKLSR
ncbi:MAG TPA: NINE protein [Saprospiraceae bacterium]|nr:NINE protein [Saprospiraceae bacterium]